MGLINEKGHVCKIKSASHGTFVWYESKNYGYMKKTCMLPNVHKARNWYDMDANCSKSDTRVWYSALVLFNRLVHSSKLKSNSF